MSTTKRPVHLLTLRFSNGELEKAYAARSFGESYPTLVAFCLGLTAQRQRRRAPTGPRGPGPMLKAARQPVEQVCLDRRSGPLGAFASRSP